MTLNPKTFEFSVHEGVATVTLNRPERLNSLTFESYAELASTFQSMNAEESIRAVVITGKGRGFCSGGDVSDIIAELFTKDTSGMLEFTRITGHLIQSICELRRPVIAAVNGVAVGAGAVISIACDMRIAAPQARFGFIFPKVGLSGADMGASYLLPKIIGQGRAAELLFFGDIIDAQTAFQMGLANRITPEGETLSMALEWAGRLSRGPAFAHRMTKQMLLIETHMSLSAAIEAEAQAQAICMLHPDFREAFEANQSKRAPQFLGAPPMLK